MIKKMKKALRMLVVIVIMMAVFAGSAMAAEQPIRVFVDGLEVSFPDQRPFVNSDNRTMVPVRFVSEALGAKVEWIALTRTVKIDYDGKLILLEIGQKKATVGADIVSLDTAPVIYNDRTMVPLRFVSEGLGAVVDWRQLDTAAMINIFTKGQSPEDQLRIIEGSKAVIEGGGGGEFWGYENPGGKMPDAAKHDAQVAADKASVTSDLAVVSPRAEWNSGAGLDLAIQIKMWLPLAPQYADAERLLAARIGTADTKTVLDYAKTKTNRDVRLPKKTWTIQGRTVQVMEGPSDQGIEIRAYYAQ
jgi:aromatic ring-cleaving dioxygenase